MKNVHKIVSILMILALQLDVFAQLTIIVKNHPEPLSSEESIYISGNFEGWSGGISDYKLIRKGNNYSITLPKCIGPIEYKFTKGSWNSVETDENSNEIANRKYDCKLKPDTIYATIKAWTSDQSTAAPNVYVIDEEFYMPLLKRHRKIRIYLPPDYDTSTKKYPVIYMHDGQNLFDKTTAYLNEWEVDETLNKLSSELDFNVIVVGVDNGEKTRMDEYNPWNHEKYGGGEGNKYISFIVDNLKPHIDSTLRTLSDQQNTGMIGSSMGGLVSFYAGLKYPKIFGKVGVFSPSFWIADDVKQFTKENNRVGSSRIFFLAGDQESESMESDMLKIISLLKESNPLTRNNYKSKIVEGGEHNETLWKEEFANAVKWLFNP